MADPVSAQSRLPKVAQDAHEVLSLPMAVAAGAVLVAGFIADGALGVMARPLQHALTWLAILACLATTVASSHEKPAWSSVAQNRLRVLSWASVVAGLLLAAVLLISPLEVVNVLGVAVTGAILALLIPESERRGLASVSLAVAVLGIFHAACDGIPSVYMLADAWGSAIGRVGGFISRKPLSVGATYAGLDLLVAMLALYGLALWNSASPRRSLAIYGLLGIIAAHLIYLIALSRLPGLLGEAPPPPPENPIPGIPAPVSWMEMIRPLVPWNVPMLATVLHAAVAIAMLRFMRWGGAESARPKWGLAAGVAVTAVALGMTMSLWWRTPDLDGKKIVFYEKGYLNWNRPKHGDYGHLSIGMYGMLPEYLRSLGAKPLISADLSEADLSDASALVLIFPDEKAPFTQEQLNRIDRFVRGGRTLLLFGEHTILNGGKTFNGGVPYNEFNRVLSWLLRGKDLDAKEPGPPPSMYVAFDSAMMRIGGWLHSYEQLSHPATAGIRDDRNTLGVVTGASVHARWPARSVIVGRHGWNDPGDEGNTPSMMGNRRYDAGERLGDILLAAEQRVGKGRIVVFGDTSSIGNGILISSHPFISRLFGYIVDRDDRQGPGRQTLALLLAIAVLGLLVYARSAQAVAVAAVALGGSIAACTSITHSRATLLPEAHRLMATSATTRPADVQPITKLAYIVASHLSAASDESLRPDGLLGLSLNLMRNGYLVLSMPQIDERRLSGANLLISIAPQRPFSLEERRIIRRFIENGGTFILTAGYECEAASRAILSDYRFRIGEQNIARREPEPMGWRKASYLDVTSKDEKGNEILEYQCFVRFHAAWPVACDDPNARPIVYGPADSLGREKRSPMMHLAVGKGQIIVIGDTSFAMNKNLENMDGSAIEGLRENAVFWQWLLTDLIGGTNWVPPRPVAEAPSPEADVPTTRPSTTQPGEAP